MSSCDSFLAIMPGFTGGLTVRTAPNLKALITELIENSGEEIAYWIEAEAKRVADIWREQERLSIPIVVTTGTHPGLVKCFLEISYDNGMVNRLEPQRESWKVPRQWESVMANLEETASALTDESRNLVCTGDIEDIRSFSKHPDFITLQNFLQEFFDTEF